jgi:hypothetical protein
MTWVGLLNVANGKAICDLIVVYIVTLDSRHNTGRLSSLIASKGRSKSSTRTVPVDNKKDNHVDSSSSEKRRAPDLSGGHEQSLRKCHSGRNSGSSSNGCECAGVDVDAYDRK